MLREWTERIESACSAREYDQAVKGLTEYLYGSGKTEQAQKLEEIAVYRKNRFSKREAEEDLYSAKRAVTEYCRALEDEADSSADRLCSILENFPLFCSNLYMSKIHEKCSNGVKNHLSGFSIENEYDLQKLMLAALSAVFPDVRTESVQDSGHHAVRRDIVIDSQVAVIELKCTRKNMTERLIIDEIRQKLYELQDIGYRDFQAKLIPNIAPDSIIGVRTPALRKLAKELSKRPDIALFLQDLPHAFFDENQLHAFLISQMKDDIQCLEQIERFLPYIDNWATCDQLSPKVFKKYKTKLLTSVREWIKSDQTYTVRFGIGMLMQHFLDEDFDSEFPQMVTAVRSEEYYINMMIAWYFATALAKQYDAVLPYIEQKKLDVWTHNKTIQKAVESYRITPEQKEYLRSLKIRG